VSVGLARTIYIRCIYGVFGREITKYTVYIYGSGQPYCSDAQPMARYILLSNLLRLCDTCTFKRPVESSAPSTSIHICPQKHAWSGGALSNCTCYSASLFPTAHVTAHHFFNCTCYSASLFPTAHVTAHHFFQLHMLQRITFSNCTCYSASFFQLHMLQRITFSSCTCYSASRFWHPLLPSKSQGLGPESLQDSLTVKLYQVTSLQYCFLKNTGSEIWKDTAGCKNT